MTKFKHMKNGNSMDTSYVLVVDDDVEMRMMLSELLEFVGFRVVGCANGIEAIKAFIKALKDDNLPCAIFLDLDMPYFSGWEILELFEITHPKLQNVPVLIISAADKEQVKKIDERYHVLCKPFSMEELIQVIRNIGLKCNEM